MNQGLFGWKKDRYDHRDYLHMVSKREFPTRTVLNPLPDVRDQGNLGSCVGFGIGGMATGMAEILETYVEWFSPTWIYNGARFIEGSLNQDAGAYPRDALDWLISKGCLLEHFWPYVDVLDKTPPPSKYDPEAAKWPLLSYYRITGGVDAICDAIASGHFVALGSPWFYSWMNPGMTGILPNISSRDRLAGGHETFLYGYDAAQGYFYGQNSWGPNWGGSGRYVMPFQAFDYFNRFGGYDAHYITVDWKAEPVPVPVPEPEPTRFPIKLKVLTSVDNGVTWDELFSGDVGNIQKTVKYEKS